MSDWDRRFLQVAELIATWSKDTSTQVGAVIVDQQKRIVSTGFNGFPAKIYDNPILLQNRESKYARIIHGEANALLYAKRDLTDCKIYIYPFLSCVNCSKMIIQAGITHVVTLKMDEASERYLRWKDDFDLAKEMYIEAGVKVLELDEI